MLGIAGDAGIGMVRVARSGMGCQKCHGMLGIAGDVRDAKGCQGMASDAKEWPVMARSDRECHESWVISGMAGDARNCR